jgi:hypothetical protein
MKHEQLGEARNFYCIPKLFLGEAIANSLLTSAPPMLIMMIVDELIDVFSVSYPNVLSIGELDFLSDMINEFQSFLFKSLKRLCNQRFLFKR